MYIEVKQDNQCSKCGMINQIERVSRENSTFIRCRNCGHEKLISTMTIYPETGQGINIYTSTTKKGPELF